VRLGQLFVVAGGVAVAQLQTFQIDVLLAGQAHLAAARPSAAAAKRRDGGHRRPRVRDVLLETDQDVPRVAVDKRVAAADPVIVAGPLGAADVEMGENTVDLVQTHLTVLLCEPTAQGRTDGIDKRRQHRADVAPGEELLPDRRPGDHMRGGRLRGAVVVLDRGGQLLHHTQTERGQLRTVRGRAADDRREGTGRVLRAHGHHGVVVLRRSGQVPPGAVGLQVLHGRTGRRVRAERPVRSVP